MSINMPPVSLEAEEAILGSILFDSGAISIAKDLVSTKEFFNSGNQEIFSACLKLHETDKPCDFMAVSAYLNDRGLLNKVGGIARLSQLLNSTVSAVNVDRYCILVKNKYLSRKLIQTGHEIVELGYDQTIEVVESLADSQRKLNNVAKETITSGLETAFDVTWKTIGDLDNIRPIFLSGLTDLDKHLIGFEPGTLTLIAGRPSMGKSAVGLNLAFRHLVNYPESQVAFFSLEMTKQQLMTRMLSLVSAISFYQHKGVSPLAGDRLRLHRTKMKPLTPQESENIVKLGNITSELNLHINDNRRSTVQTIGANLRQLKSQKGDLGLVIIDYLQMMNLSGSAENRSYELGEIGRGLYQLSSELDVPIIALSQVNRACENRNDKRPMMSDLSQSGILEMIADNIIFCYRDQYYDENTCDKNVLELILRKARHGSTGTAKLFFNPEFGHIEDLY